MKRIILVLISVLFCSLNSFSQEYVDVVYLKNGSIIRGVIIEQTPNKSLKIKTSDGSIFVYKMEEVAKMTKEEKTTKTTGSSEGYSNYDGGGLLIIWFGSEIWVEGEKLDKQTNLFLHLYLDYYMMEKFAFGVYINKSLNSAFEDATGVKDNMFEIGIALKPRLKVNEKFFLKPGLDLGYRIHNSPDLPDDNKIKGFGINIRLEGQYVINENSKFSTEFGFLAQPAGGNDLFDFQYAPIILLGFGYTYSF